MVFGLFYGHMRMDVIYEDLEVGGSRVYVYAIQLVARERVCVSFRTIWKVRLRICDLRICWTLDMHGDWFD